MAYIKLYKGDTPTGTATDITTLAQVDNVRRNKAPVSSVFADSSGPNVSVLQSSLLGRPTIEMDLWVYGSPSTRRDSISSLAATLNIQTPRALKFEDDGEWYYVVVSQGAKDVEDFIDSSRLHLTFESVYPWQWGDAVTYTQSQLETGVTRKGNLPSFGSIGVDGTTEYITPDSNGKWGFDVYAPNAPGARKEFFFTGLGTSRRTAKIDSETCTSIFSSTLYKAPMPSSYGGWPIFDETTVKISNACGTFTKMRIRPRRM